MGRLHWLTWRRFWIIGSAMVLVLAVIGALTHG